LKSNFVFSIYSMHLASLIQPLSLELVPLQGPNEVKGSCTRVGTCSGRGEQMGKALVADRSAAHALEGWTGNNAKCKLAAGCQARHPAGRAHK
jgi:hypothetical protein